jgi:hypothetical protein
MGLLQPHGGYRRGNGQASITARIVFNGHAEAVFLLEAARRAGQRIALITPEGASALMGAAWFAALQDLLLPLDAIEIVYDCGARTGDALAALRHGVRAVRLDPGAHTLALQNLAGKSGAVLYDDRGECLAFSADPTGEKLMVNWLSAAGH